MDPADNTEVNLNISLDSDFFVDKPTTSDESDFIIADLCRSYLTKEREDETNENNGSVIQSSSDNSDTDVSLPGSPKMDCEATPEHMEDFKTVMDVLINDHENWKDKYYQSENQLAECEVKMAEYMKQVMTLQTELNTLIEEKELLRKNHCTTTTKLEEKNAELKQFKGLVQKQITAEEEMQALKKEVSELNNKLKKHEKSYQNAVNLLSRRNKVLTNMRRDNKRLLAHTLEFSEMLVSKNLLPIKRIKTFESFMESIKIENFDSEGISEDSILSQEEENVSPKKIFNYSSENNNLPNGVTFKMEISEEQVADAYLSNQMSTNDTNMKSPMKVDLSPSLNVHSNSNIHYDISKGDKPCAFQFPFDMPKNENSSYSSIQNSKILPKNAISIPVNSHLLHHDSYGVEIISSDDVEISEEIVNLNIIKGNMVIKIEDFEPMSPLPESPPKENFLYKVTDRVNDVKTEVPLDKSSDKPKDISTPQSNKCEKNTLSQQTSAGFERNSEEISENLNSSTNWKERSKNRFETSIPPNVHYVSTSYVNDTVQVLHQGSSVIDYMVNPGLKLTTFILTMPKQLSKNSADNNIPLTDERKCSALSLYNTAVKTETSVNKEKLNSFKNKTENSVNDPFSYFSVQIDSKNGLINVTNSARNNFASNEHSSTSFTIPEGKNKQINLASNVGNNSPSDEHSSPNPTITESKNKQINLPSNIGNNSVYNECYNPSLANKKGKNEQINICKSLKNNYVCNNSDDDCLVIKEQSSEITHNKNLEADDTEQKNDNQPFLSFSCDTSPHKGKLPKSLHYDISPNKLNIEKNENHLPNEKNESLHSSLENYPHTLNNSKSFENSSIESEKSHNISLTRNFSTFKVLENLKDKANSHFDTNNLNSPTISNETAISTLESSGASEKITTSTPKHILGDKNEYENEMHLATTCDNYLDSSSPHLKSMLSKSAYSLKNETVPNEKTASVFKSVKTSGEMNISKSKCNISISNNNCEKRDNSEDAMHLAVALDNNIQVSSIKNEANTLLNNCHLNNRTITSKTDISTSQRDEASSKFILSPPNQISIDKNKFEDVMHPAVSNDNNMLSDSQNAKNEANSFINDCTSDNGKIPNETAISSFVTNETSPKMNISVSKHTSIDKNKSEHEMRLTLTSDNNMLSELQDVENKASSFLNDSTSDNRKIPNMAAVSTVSDETSGKINISILKHMSNDKNKSEDEMCLGVASDNNMLSGSQDVENEARSFLNDCTSNNEKIPNKTAVSTFVTDETLGNMNISISECTSSGKNKSEEEMCFAVTSDNDLLNSSPLMKNEVNVHSINNETNPCETAILAFEDSETSNKVTISTPKHFPIGKNNSKNEMHVPITFDYTLQHSAALVKQKLFQDTDFKTSSIQTFKSSNTLDNSNKSGEELKKATLEIVCPTKTAISSSLDEKELPNFTDLSTENDFSADIDLPAPKKRKFSFKSPIKVLTENEPTQTLSGQSPDSVKTTTESSFKKLENFQTSVLLTDNTSKNNSYGVFKNDDINFSNINEREENTVLDYVDPIKDIKNDVTPTSPKSLNITPNKNTKDIFDKNNLSNASQRKKKKKNKRKQKKISNSKGISPKKSKKFCSTKHSQKSMSLLPDLQRNLKTKSSVKQLLQKDSKIFSNSILEQSEIKNNLKPSESEKNDLSDFKSNAQINSGNKLAYENSCNMPLLDNKIIKNSEDVIHSHHQKELSEKDISIQKSNDWQKIVEKNANIISDSNHSLEDLLNHKEQVSVVPSNISTSENIEIEVKKDFSLKESDINIPSPEHYVKLTSKNIAAEDHNKFPDSNTIVQTSISTTETATNSFKNKVIDNFGIPQTEIENSVEKKFIDNFGISQSEVQNVHVRRNSYQSNISEDENPLVIADDEDCNPNSETGSNIENNKDEASTVVSANCCEESKNEAAISAESVKPVKSKQKKRKNSKTPKINKRKKSQISCEEESSCNNCTIEKALDEIKKMKYEDMVNTHSKRKLLVHKLISALINPTNAANTTSALYQIFSFLSSSKLNPLISYSIKKDTVVFYPPIENCIIEALIKTASKKKIHLEKLIPSAIVTLYYLILDKRTISKAGLGALCRIFTQLCKHTANKEKPLSLTCDLIKEQHPYAPVLIAFIIGTWVDLFEPSKDKDVYRLLYLSSIYYGLQKKPPTITSKDWDACKAVFNLPAAVPLTMDLQATTDILITTMQTIVNESSTEKDAWARDQILIFAVIEGWTWTQEKVISSVIDSLHQYAKNVENERAFAFFAELCADIGKLAPNDCLTILQALSTLFIENSDFGYVKKHAACNLLKLLIFKQEEIPECLSKYIQENADQLSETNVELYLRRRCIADASELTENDIWIT